MTEDGYDNSEENGDGTKKFLLEVNIKPIGFTIRADTENEAISNVKDEFSEEFGLTPNNEEIRTIDVVE